MKKLQFLSILALASLCFFACQCASKDDSGTDVPEPAPIDEPEGKPKPVPGTYTFDLPDFAAKPQWEAGDVISIRGSYAPDAITVTLSSADISADGKTATLRLTDIPSTFCAPDWLYAAYPGDAVAFDGSFCDEEARFAPSGAPVMVAYWEEDNHFRFRAAATGIVFDLDAAGYDAVVVGGAAHEDLLTDYVTAGYSSLMDLYTGRPSDGHPFIVKEIAPGGHYTFIFPPRTKLPNGFSIYLKQGDAYPMAYTYPDAVTFKTGQVLELGDITASLQPYGGPVPEEMEMPSVVKRTQYNVNVEELSGLCLAADGNLWGVGDQGQLARITITDEGQVTVENVKHFSNDLEGVTRDPETDILYFCAEPNSVYRVPAPYTAYERIFKVEQAADFGNSGLEGITWYKDNTLYVGSQVGSYLWRYSLSGEVLDFVSLKEVKASVREVGGLCYDALNDWLWVTDSEAQTLWIFTGDARTYLGRIKIPFAGNCESVCVDHARGCVWVGDDDDSQPHIYRLDMEGLTPELTEEG